MDIRTKLVFALVAVSLASMYVLGGFTYAAVRNEFQGLAMRQLDAVAQSKKQDLDNALAAWGDRLDLIRSRTQLRLSMREYGRTGSGEERERIHRILSDARESVRAVHRIAVFDASGAPVATVGEASAPEPRGSMPGDDSPPVGPRYGGVAVDAAGRLEVVFRAPMELEGSSVGSVEVVIGAVELDQIAEDRTGLGETGEALVVMRGPGGEAVFLNPLRHETAAPLTLRIPSDRTDVAAVRAVHGEEGVFRNGFVDYRGESVWAATRFLPELGWGVVVKIDAAEELGVIAELRETMIELGLSLAGLAVVVGTLLGLYFARPVRELADVAARIRRGERDLRAKVRSEDELGRLAQAFNQMTDELVEMNRALEDRVAKHEGEERG
jgi:HAMP domain-containing protein